jgi:translation initiation factor 3 subunit B
MIRAGENWATVANYEHKGIDNCAFSPAEKYLITYLPENSPEPNHYTIWDIPTGKELRSFKKGDFFRWSHDDKYFARLADEKIFVYETPGCELLEKKSFIIPGIIAFEWCPSRNIIAAFVLGQHNMPSFLLLIEVPSRREIYRKSLFSVKTSVMKWQSEGKYLSLQVDRLNKSGKATITSFEIFDVQQPTRITTEILPIPKTENVRLFEWEPTGNRFAIIHAEGSGPKCKVSFYQLGKKKLIHRATLENRIAKNLFWAPKGSYLVIGGQNGSLEFYNAVLGETMSEGDHYGVSALKWDPTGRYVCTYVSAWRSPLDNGYIIRTFKGDVVHKVLKDQFFDFQWRLRPPSLLSPEKEAEIRLNLKEYAARFQKEDDGMLGVIVDARFKEQQRLLQDYRDRIKSYKKLFLEQREQRRSLRGGAASDDEGEYETITTTIETVLDEAEEEVFEDNEAE